MRRFLLVTHAARTAPDFSLDDLPGSGGRMDLVARCVVSALLTSYKVRTDAECWVLLQGPPETSRLVRFLGAEIRSLNPDERSTAALVRKALAVEGLAEKAAHPGVRVRGASFADALAELSPPILLLNEGGTDLRAASVGENTSFVLSDHKDLTHDEEAAVRKYSTSTVSVGPVSLQADQVITIVHNELDRR